MTLYEALIMQRVPLIGPPQQTQPDDYKTWLINKIQSGATDYTYGPGSPGATPSDMRQRKGARENMLATGDIALPLKDYRLFSPAERNQYGIADTSWVKEGVPTPPGSVERYYGAGADTSGIPPMLRRPPEQMAQQPDILSQFANYMGARPLSTQDFANYQAAQHPTTAGANQSSWGQYAQKLEGAETMKKVGGSIASGIQGFGQGLQAQAKAGNQAATDLLRKRSMFADYMDALLRGEGI